MSEESQGPGRPPGGVNDTPHKRWRALQDEIDSRADDICHKTLEPLSGWYRPRAPAANSARNANQNMDNAIKEPIELRTIETIEDVGRVLGDIVAAVAQGKLTPREGVMISKIVEARRKAFESIEFKKQLDDLQQEFDDDRTAKP